MDAHFFSSVRLADIAPVESREFFRLALVEREGRERRGIPSDSVYSSALFVVVRVFGHLCARKEADATSLRGLEELIEQFVSAGQRASIWSLLGEHVHRAARQDLFEYITERLELSIKSVPAEARAEKVFAIHEACPFLYTAAPSLFRKYVDALSAVERDQAYMSVGWYVLKYGTSAFPMQSSERVRRALHQSALLEVCDIASNVQEDIERFALLSAVAKKLRGGDSAVHYSREQIQDLAGRIQELARWFPSGRSVAHLGCRIALEAYAMGLVKEKGKPRWKLAVEAAAAVPCASDSAYTIAIVLEAYGRPESDDVVRDAILLCDDKLRSIGSIHEEAQRNIDVAVRLLEVLPMYAKRCVRRAMTLCAYERNARKEHDIYDAALDVAYRMGPEFADEVAASLDTDPARKQARSYLKHRNDTLRKKEKFVSDADALDSLSDSEVEDAAWRALDLLRDGRMGLQRIDALLPLMRRAASMPLSRSLPAYLCFVEHVALRASSDSSGTRALQMLCEGSLAAVSSSVRLALGERCLNRTGGVQEKEPGSGRSDGVTMIGPDDRENATAQICDWLDLQESDAEIWLADPWYGLEDLEVLIWVANRHSGARVTIVCGTEKLGADPETAIRHAWRMQFPSDVPPETLVVTVATQSGKCPLHDRWMLSEKNGLRLGTSIGSLGRGRISEVSFMPSGGVEDKLRQVQRLATARERSLLGERLIYKMFSLTE